MILKNTNINPSMLDSEIDVGRAMGESNRRTRKAYEEQLAKLKAFEETDQGQTVKALAEPMIASLDYRMGLSIKDLGLPLDQANEYRAELRGARSVWMYLKNAPEMLASELAKIPETQEEKEDKTKAKWRPLKSKEKKR